MNVSTIGFVYNFPCPLECNFCCHTQENVGPGRLTVDNVLPLVLDFAAQKSVRRFAFTGGDPFIYRTDIIKIMQAARDSGVLQPFHIVTSGYWAKSADKTMRCLAPLKQLGMDVLFVSYDYEHSKWVRPEQVGWIVDACAELNIRVEVCGVFWEEDQRVEDVLDLPDWVKTYSTLALSIGKARDIYGGTRRYNVDNALKGVCGKAANYDVTIYPNGDVYPCCSGGFNKEAKLNVGNAFRDSASDILKNVYRNFPARLAKEIDFRNLYKLVEESDQELFKRLTPFDAVDTVCEICRDLNKEEDLRHALQPYYDRMEVDYALSEFDRHSALIGD